MIERLTGLLVSAARHLTPERLRPYAHTAFSVDSDEALRRCLDQESHAEARTELNDWQRVNWLREWVYRHVPDATFSRSLDSGHSSVYAAEVHQILRRLAAERCGFKCAGAVTILTKLCELFGYPASLYNMGDAFGSRASHCVTLVEVPSGGATRWAVVDPYFNQSLEDGTGQPIDFRTVIDLLLESRADAIRIVTRRRKRLMLMGGDDRQRIQRLRAHRMRLVRSSDGLLFGRSVSTLSGWMRDHPEASAWMAEQGLPADPLYLMLVPINVHGDPRCRELADYAGTKRNDFLG